MGVTPNPDIYCNKEIKFNYFLKFALSQKCDKVATGHYAIVEKNINFCLKNFEKQDFNRQSYNSKKFLDAFLTP